MTVQPAIKQILSNSTLQDIDTASRLNANTHNTDTIQFFSLIILIMILIAIITKDNRKK